MVLKGIIRMNAENKLKFYIHDPEGLEWNEFDFYNKENIPLLKKLISEGLEKGGNFIQFDIGDVAIFEEYHIEPPKFAVWFFLCDEFLTLDFDGVFERAQRIIRFYNHFGKDMPSFLELLNVMNSYLDNYGDNFEEIVDEWVGM